MDQKQKKLIKSKKLLSFSEFIKKYYNLNMIDFINSFECVPKHIKRDYLNYLDAKTEANNCDPLIENETLNISIDEED